MISLGIDNSLHLHPVKLVYWIFKGNVAAWFSSIFLNKNNIGEMPEPFLTIAFLFVLQWTYTESDLDTGLLKEEIPGE